MIQPAYICSALFSVMTLGLSADERPYFNDLKAPESRHDLESIQRSLQKNLKKTRAATVCVKLNEGSGSGVIVSEDGLIYTAAHVSGGVGKQLKILMEDGREYEAISLGLNSTNDAAMLQIQSDETFPFVQMEEVLADKSTTTLVGDWVFSLGHSGGFDQSRGSVVRLGRVVRVATDTLKTDCLLIGGDSGGPLFDMNGVLIGIHSRVGHLSFQNMHVPVQMFHKDAEELKSSKFIGDGPFAKKSEAGSGFIGVAVTEVELGLKITIVELESSADDAGVKVGDIITALAGEPVRRKAEMAKLLKKMAAADKVELKYLRDGKESVVELTLKSRS